MITALQQPKQVEAQSLPGTLTTSKNHRGSCNGNDAARVKPWSVDRTANLDKLATEIMAAETMKIINPAYEDVFAGSLSTKIGAKENGNDGLQANKMGAKDNLIHGYTLDVDSVHSLCEENNDAVHMVNSDAEHEVNSDAVYSLHEANTDTAHSLRESNKEHRTELRETEEGSKVNDTGSLKESLGHEDGRQNDGSESKNICVSESSSSKELRLTVEGLNEAARDSSKVVRGLSTLHLRPKWMD